MKRLALIFILAGFAFYGYGIYMIWENTNPNRLNVKKYGGHFEEATFVNPPVRLTVEDIGIDLPIYPAEVKNGKWDTTTEGASYLISSAMPGEKGKSIIYAHNWESLFGPLFKVRKGMEVRIVFDDGSERFFKINDMNVVSVSKASILFEGDRTELVMYTCAGFLDSKRLIVSAVNI